jgi:hypothetical protein
MASFGLNRRRARLNRASVSLCCAILCILADAVNTSWVDPDTPEKGQTTASLTKGDDRQYTLVSFSDVALVQFLGGIASQISTESFFQITHSLVHIIYIKGILGRVRRGGEDLS